MFTPFESSEICLTAPGLINGEDDLLLQVQTKVGQGKLLPQNEVSVRVGRQSDRINLPVAHGQVLFHYIPHYIHLWHWKAFLLQFLLNTSCRINKMILLVHIFDFLSYLLTAKVLSVSHSD